MRGFGKERAVEKVQVDVVGAQLLEGGVEGADRVVDGGPELGDLISDTAGRDVETETDLGRDEELGAGNTALGDGNTHLGLVAIHLGTINVAVSKPNGRLDSLDESAVERAAGVGFVPGGARAVGKGRDGGAGDQLEGWN